MTTSDQGSEAKPKYSVLIMGKTQSGKSTLVQFVKKYADRQYEINTSLIGRGNVALTALPMPFVVRSNLPEYEVVQKESGIALDLSNLANMATDDDYLDHISYREEEYELCEVQRQQDVGDSLPELELTFLDTPGINDTNNDSEHAERIIEEVKRIGSFNLILFVFKYDNPLTVEQQLSLKYYAEVLKEFRSRMALLFTHVKYENCHPTNSRHQTMIDTQHKALSRLVQGLEIEPCSSESITATNDKDYMVNLPHFTIDFTDKKRPVQQWMIRDTLRKILHLAVVNTPAVMDTGKENIDRITNILHPTKLNDERRKEIRICQSDVKRHEEPVGMIRPTGESETTEEQINILLLGDVQSGKTSLVETMRLYADPNYVVKRNLINHGILHTVDKVRVTSFLSDLPTVEIRKQQGNDVINLDMESKTMTEEDFDDLLSWTQKDVRIRVVPSGSPKKYRFNIYEGPSLNESHGNFEKNVFNIHKTIVKSEAKFHLVLFTLAPGPITAAIKSTVRVCADIFSDLSPLFSFVHTKIDYSRLHIGNKKFKEFVQERQCILWQQILEQQSNKYHINQMDSKTPDPKIIQQQHIQSTSVPYLIDCGFEIKWPVRQGKTQNVVRDILSTAVQQKAPVAIGNSLIKKTPKMIVIDTSLKWRAKDEFEKSNEVINNYNALQVTLLNALGEVDKGIETIVKGLSQGTTDGQGEPIEDLEVVYENSYEVKDENNAVISSSTMEFVSHGRTLERLEMSSRNIEIEQRIGGEGHDHWMIVYRREIAADASLDVKLYARKPDSKGSSVGEPEGLVTLRRQRIELEQQLAVVEARMMYLWKVQDEYFLLREWISRMSLPAAVMEELTKAEVYEAKETPFDKIKEIYLKSGGVYDTDPCESAETPAEWLIAEFDDDEFFLWDCKICGEGGCDKAACKAELNPETGSVLMFGKTQAGKSSFIEFVKSYADPEYEIDHSRIGTGFRSKTAMPVEFVVKSNLPVYEVFDSSDTRIDIGTLGDKYVNPEDYSDALNDRKVTLRTVPHNPGSLLPFVEITFLDTPGIEDTNGRDVEHAPKIIEAMTKMQSLNLIIIIVNCKDTPSVSHQLACNYYSKVIHTFQGHHSNIVFLYTHADYEKCHHSNTEHLSVMKLRHKAFSQLFRCQGSYSRDDVSKATIELYPMYNIDLKEHRWPITQCMRLTTLREILSQVVNKPPVILDTSPSNLQRIKGIPHPDNLNKMHRKKILETTKAILENQEPCADVLVKASEGSMTQEDNPNITGDDGRVADQSICGLDDGADYFSDLEQPGSGDEDENDSYDRDV